MPFIKTPRVNLPNLFSEITQETSNQNNSLQIRLTLGKTKVYISEREYSSTYIQINVSVQHV